MSSSFINLMVLGTTLSTHRFGSSFELKNVLSCVSHSQSITFDLQQFLYLLQFQQSYYLLFHCNLIKYMHEDYFNFFNFSTHYLSSYIKLIHHYKIPYNDYLVDYYMLLIRRRLLKYLRLFN